MRLLCFWCCLLAGVVRAHNGLYYGPQTFAPSGRYTPALFSPAGTDGNAQSTILNSWAPAPVNEQYRGSQEHNTPPRPDADGYRHRPEAWRLPFTTGGLTKEQQAAIIHHKQSLTSDGAFRFEYASDNGLAAGEQIEPDGSRVGAYQYKDPSGRLVKLKYRAGKDGFQILEGSHLPKSPEPVPPKTEDNYYQQAYAQQKQQFNLQQTYNLQKPTPQTNNWGQNQGPEQRPPGNQYFLSNWRPQVGAAVDDGQYHNNEVDKDNKPHNFGAGYAFSFQG